MPDISHAWRAQWPGPAARALAPSFEDAQTAPTAQQLLPQVLKLAPRGAVWGTDEAGERARASPVMVQFWTAVAAWVADLNIRESITAAQAFPSLADATLEIWEAELGLPGPGERLAGSPAARQATVRIRAAGVDGVSPADFIRLASLGGAVVTVEEPDQFRLGMSELGPAFDDEPPPPDQLALLDVVSDGDAWGVVVIRVADLGDFGSRAELAAALRPFVPLHVEMVVA